jgi:hypothetical protein
MMAMVAPQPYTVQRQHAFSTSQNLLSLDCSADLKSYRRDLGPGVQAKCFEKTSDTIRAQLDDHRAFLLQHRQSGRASGFPSPVPRLEVPQSHTVPSSNNAVPPPLTAPNNNNNNNYHVAYHPRPLQILSQPHAPQPMIPQSRQRSPVPVPGNISTYPTALRHALEHCSQYGHQYEPEVLYEVIMETASKYREDSRDVVGTYESLREANLRATDVFLFNGYYAAGANTSYEVSDEGGLKCDITTDAPTGGSTIIYVERVAARRVPGPRR